MPEIENKADPVVMKAVSDWQRKHPDMKTACSICGSTEWAVGVICNLLEPATNNPFPVIPLRCTHCSHVVLLSAVQVGLLRPES
jgi:hypothetical protein